MSVLSRSFPLSVHLFASPVYWSDAGKRAEMIEEVERAIRQRVRTSQDDPAGVELRFVVVDSDAALEKAVAEEPGTGASVFVALSGAVQPWMTRLAEKVAHLAVFHAYLPGALAHPVEGRLMHANAHPASTDFFAFQQRMGKAPSWFFHAEEIGAFASSWQTVRRLSSATLLKIGETEPWVINSPRDPSVIRGALGTRVIPMERKDLYDAMKDVSEAEVDAEAAPWIHGASSLDGVEAADVRKASRVTAGMKKLLARHGAVGLSMACFAMIGDLDTTSCLALSTLNATAASIGACEGDLDAALTQLTLKSLGADFQWIGNPIIRQDDAIDLAHCTAPSRACGGPLAYRLMRHHESGRGVSPEVRLPGEKIATLSRIGLSSGRVVAHVGRTEVIGKLPACHTQIRVNVASSRAVIRTLPGTHLVLSYGDFHERLRTVAAMAGLAFDGSVLEERSRVKTASPEETGRAIFG